jgi:hypothetical protein
MSAGAEHEAVRFESLKGRLDDLGAHESETLSDQDRGVVVAMVAQATEHSAQQD